ncbi:MAG: creatininase family protein [Haloarculaceae archaeon]
MSQSHYAPFMHRDELMDQIDSGAVAVVPTGSLEQHGPHLPVGTDSLLAEAVVREGVDLAAEDGTPAVAFPAIWTGFSPHHVPLGATVSLSKETLVALLDDVCSSLLEMGFDRVLLVNGHGGNRPAVSLVAGDLGTRQDEADVAEINYNTLARERFGELRSGETGSAYHAGEFETSLMLHLYGEHVDAGAATDDPATPSTDYSPRDMFAGGPLGMRRTYDFITEDGVRGEPTLGTAEVGTALFEAATEGLADVIAAVRSLERERRHHPD